MRQRWVALATFLVLLVAAVALLPQQLGLGATPQPLLLALSFVAVIVAVIGILADATKGLLALMDRLHRARPPEPNPPTPQPPRGVQSLPERLEARPRELTQVRESLMAAAPGGRATAIVGLPGAGKTVLASMAARDPQIRRAFPDDPLWIAAGPRPHLVDLQTRLAHLIGRTSAAFTDVEIGRADLRAWLADRACLLIVDDVWDASTLDGLACVGDKGALLFTTRDREIARARAGHESCVEVHELERTQALGLLARWASTPERPLASGDLPAAAQAICARVGNLALGVAIAGGMVAGRGGTSTAWKQIRQLFETGIRAIRVRSGPDGYAIGGLHQGREEAILLKTIELSINELGATEQQRYRELAIFAGRGPIPPAAVEMLWGFTEEDTAHLLAILSDRSLIQHGLGGRFILHDLQYDVTRLQVERRSGGMVAAHRKLVRAYEARCPGGLWSKASNDGYYFQNLTYHLRMAGLQSELESLLVDFEWMQAKLDATDVVTLLGDYEQPSGEAAELIRRVLGLSVPVLADDARSLPGQLVGRLIGGTGPAIERLLEATRSHVHGPWLCPLTPALAPSDGPLEMVLMTRPNRVTALAVTPDGARIVSGGSDQSLQVRRLGNGLLEQTLVGHRGCVRAVAVTPDGHIVSYGEDRTVRVWSLISGAAEHAFFLKASLYSRARGFKSGALAVAADGTWVVAAGGDNRVSGWRLYDGKVLPTYSGHRGTVSALATIPNSQRLASGDTDGWLHIWRPTDAGLERRVRGRSGVTALAVTPDGRRIVVGASDGTVSEIDLDSRSGLRIIGGHAGSVTALSTTSDGRCAVSVGIDSTVRVWGLEDAAIERTYKGHADAVLAVAAVPGQRRAVSGGDDGTIRVWNLEREEAAAGTEGHSGRVTALAVGTDGTLVSGGADATVRIRDSAHARTRLVLRGHEGGITGIASFPDGGPVATVATDHTVRVWAATNGDLLRTFDIEHAWYWEMFGHDDSGTLDPISIGVAQNGWRVFAGGDDNLLRVWGLKDGKRERLVATDGAAITAMEISRDGKLVVCGSETGGVHAWRLEPRRFRHQASINGHQGRVTCLAITDGGSAVVSGGADGKVVILSIVTGRIERLQLGHSGGVTTVAAGLNGRFFASAGLDGYLRVFDSTGGSEIARWTGDIGVTVQCCRVLLSDPSVLVYGDSGGGVNLLRLIGAT